MTVRTPVEALERYERLLLVRRFEELQVKLSTDGAADGVVLHSALGQEVPAVGVALHRRPEDVAFSTHRGSAHCVAWGVELEPLLAENLGRRTGIARGLVGHMHIIDPGSGLLGTNGVVGAGLPMAVGAALALKRRGVDGVAVAFFGDGAANTGAALESLNLARAWQCPVLFVCEQNGLAEMTYSEPMTAGRLSDRFAAMDIGTQTVDGSDLDAVDAAAEEALATVRADGLPRALVCSVHRRLGHYVGDNEHYRDPADHEGEVDALDLFAERHGLSEDERAAALTRIDQQLEAIAGRVLQESQPTAEDFDMLAGAV